MKNNKIFICPHCYQEIEASPECKHCGKSPIRSVGQINVNNPIKPVSNTIVEQPAYVENPLKLLQETQIVNPVTPQAVKAIDFGIETIEDIFKVLKKNPEFSDWGQYGNVTVKSEGDYLLFNYNALATYEGTWNAFERMSRGLIIDKVKHQLLAYPFDKFFNWGQHGWATESKIDYVTAKMDGSLGVCWFDYQRDMWRITTRGSFNSEQAIWATNHLNRQYGVRLSELSKSYTYLFEIIYPDNRIVVDYGQYEGLILLAARVNIGSYPFEKLKRLRYIANQLLCPIAPMTVFDKVEDIIDYIPNLAGIKKEGFVSVHVDGTRWKFKGDDYLRIHKVISTLSFKNVLKAVSEGTYLDWIEAIPDEFLSEIKDMRAIILSTVDKAEKDIDTAYDVIIQNIVLDTDELLGGTYRKIFAQNVKELYPKLAPFLFRKLDKKLDRKFIFQKWDFSGLEGQYT